MKPVQTSKKSHEKVVFSNLLDKRQKQKPKIKLGVLVRISDIRLVFSKRDSTNYSYKVYTTIEVLQNTIPLYKNNYLPERYNHNLLLSTKVTLEENNQVLKNLN